MYTDTYTYEQWLQSPVNLPRFSAQHISHRTWSVLTIYRFPHWPCMWCSWEENSLRTTNILSSHPIHSIQEGCVLLHSITQCSADPLDYSFYLLQFKVVKYILASVVIFYFSYMGTFGALEVRAYAEIFWIVPVTCQLVQFSVSTR
jgi:hypothetical protein